MIYDMLPKFLADEIEKSKPLSRSEERRLSEIIQTSDDPDKVREARDKLAHSGLRYVVRVIIRDYHITHRLELEEMLSAGTMGLYRAAERFDGRNHKVIFTTYAHWWIKREIGQYIQDAANIARVPASVQYHVDKLTNVASEIAQITQDDSVNQVSVAELMNLNPQKIASAIASSSFVSPIDVEDLPVRDSDLEEQSVQIRAMLPGLMKAIGELPEREQDIICRYYGIGCPEHTCREIADYHCLTRERIRQIKMDIEKKLMRALSTGPSAPPSPNTSSLPTLSQKTSPSCRSDPADDRISRPADPPCPSSPPPAGPDGVEMALRPATPTKRSRRSVPRPSLSIFISH